ncbi:MAG: PEGA domain-containing protein [Deltaproteobacteria bacterium]|nr:PEGA domain-containing protein [Deltaproteobacteria bacterium]
MLVEIVLPKAFRVTVTVTLLVCAVCSVSLAQTPTESEGRRVAEKAAGDAQARRYTQAVDGFKKAWDLTRDSAYLYNVAALYLLRLDEPAKAWEWAARYGDEARSTDEKKEAKDLLSKAESVLCDTHGKLTVTVDPVDAEVWLGMKSPGNLLTRKSNWVRAGRHRVFAAGKGYDGTSVRVVVKEGVEAKVSLKLVGRIALLTVHSRTVGCEVSLDGEYLGRTPIEKVVKPGRYLVRAEAKGHQPFEKKVTVRPGEKVLVQADLKPRAAAAPSMARPAPAVTKASFAPVEKTVVGEPPREPTRIRKDGARIAAWVTMGTGMAAAVAGAISYGLAYRDHQDLNGMDPKDFVSYAAYDSAWDSRASRGRTRANAAYGLWGAGAAALGVGLALYFALPPDQSVTVVPTGNGIATTIRF